MKKKYKIMFYRFGKPYFMICTRTYDQCFNISMRHIKKLRCFYFKIKEHNDTV